MTETLFDADLRALADSFFGDHVEQARAARAATGALPDEVWRHARDLGLTGIGLPASAGGSDGTLGDALTVLASAARAGIPLPLAEHHLASWLLAQVGHPVPETVATVVLSAPGDTLSLDGGELHGSAADVPWGSAADLAVTLLPDPGGTPHVVAFAPRHVVTATHVDLAGEPTASVAPSGRPAVVEPAPSVGDDLFWLGALCRTAQISGALDATLTLTLRYASERVQFGRPISAFQAVQQHLVVLAQAAETANMAMSLAARSAVQRSPRWTFDVAAAKLVANESARTGARAAHQVHGAIGMTREYPLHHFTRRLHLWRLQFGTERGLSDALGTVVAGTAGPSLMPIVADTDRELVVPWPT